MRVLIVTEGLVLGGAETFVLRLARRLRQDGHEADILCLNPDFEDPRLIGQFPDQFIYRIPKRGLRTAKRIDRIGRMLGLDVDLQQRRAERWVNRNLIGKYDIHHTNLFGADWLFTRLKRRRPELKLVSTLHGDYVLHQARRSGSERNQIAGWAAKLTETLRAVDRWVTICQPQHRQFEQEFGVPADRLVDIPNGYAPPSPLPPVTRKPGGPVTFVMVARGMREKGWGFLVDAFQRLDEQCALLLVGEGGFLQSLRDQHGDNPRITFAGAHPNPVELIATADVFVHPSIYRAESLPTVIIEALYAGRPVIATDVGEVKSMIAASDGSLAGMLVSPDESTLTDQLVAAMQAYIDDPGLRDRHAALAPAAFAKFEMGTCAAAYARLYAETISSTNANH